MKWDCASEIAATFGIRDVAVQIKNNKWGTFTPIATANHKDMRQNL